jgi:hypothetical protein
MAAFPHPSRKKQGTDVEATSCSRVGRSRRRGGRTAAMTTVATTLATQHHCTATTAVTLPSAMATEGTLVAAHQLLNNPPPPHASSSVVEQWCHNIDQLIVAAINTPPWGGQQANHSGGRPERSVVHSRMPTPAHAPTAPNAAIVPRAPTAGIATADIWAELERRHSGEDGRITIERRRERCRNLKGDYGPPVTAPAAHAMCSPSSPGVAGGCMALAPHLRMVV